jgi:DNA mismatch endonuclease (patch repair protein)
MTDKITKEKRSEVMRAVKSRDSKIEVAFRKSLWKLGFRYRKNASNYFGKPDIVLKKHKAVIFVDSCFWHGCPEHLRMPSSNRDYWVKKIEKNKSRDLAVNKHYRDNGWTVLRIWEHDLVEDLESAVKSVEERFLIHSPSF